MEPISECGARDFERIHEIINAAAETYRGVIPAECWHEPYMSREALRAEIDDEVVFWGYWRDAALIGVMGIQDRGEVTLIRHAYVAPSHRRGGVGAAILAHLHTISDRPYLVGTWAAATWAVDFYRKHGYRLVTEEEKDRLLAQFWTVPAEQVRASVVLASSHNNPAAM